MSHLVFQTAQIPTTATTSMSLQLKPYLPIPQQVGQPIVCKLRKNPTIKCASSYSPMIDGGDSVGVLERCFQASAPLVDSGSTPRTEFSPVMKGKHSSIGHITLEKGKLNLSQKKSKTILPEIELGGGGGGIGKKINHGGGDGGDDDDRGDDDYFDDFNDDDEGNEGGLFRRRKFLGELFNRTFVDAVLNEWQKTLMDLPAGIRQAYEMGLVSSAQMVKFLAINARPTTTRLISRALPDALSRAFIGRMIADPTFLYKLLLEEAATIGYSVWWELKNRKDRIKQEWDLALVNVLAAMACNGIAVWFLAPCRSYGNTFQYDLQNTLQKLPNNMFEKSYPLREFDLQKRIHSFFYKAAGLCMVGLISGAAQGSSSYYLASKKKDRLSVTIPPVSNYALGYGAFIGLYANLRYQLLCGFDKVVADHFDVVGVALFFSTAFRILNAKIGETSRLAWLGVEADPLFQPDNLLKAYNTPSEVVNISSSKSLVSGLGLLGFKQGKVGFANGESSAPRVRRKRIVRKKVSASSS